MVLGTLKWDGIWGWDFTIKYGGFTIENCGNRTNKWWLVDLHRSGERRCLSKLNTFFHLVAAIHCWKHHWPTSLPFIDQMFKEPFSSAKWVLKHPTWPCEAAVGKIRTAKGPTERKSHLTIIQLYITFNSYCITFLRIQLSPWHLQHSRKHRGYLMYLQLINLPTRRVPWHHWWLWIKHQLKWQSNSAVFFAKCDIRNQSIVPSGRELSESELVFPESQICRKMFHDFCFQGQVGRTQAPAIVNIPKPKFRVGAYLSPKNMMNMNETYVGT